ncbi:MAG TPA: hypothetical protein VGO09_03435 [Flavisolibacter sp.]|nr:hypothetical protein [Flavisolibacter sp.]
MKIAFFLIAFSLVFFRFYTSLKGTSNQWENKGTMTISNGDHFEELKFAGKIVLNNDETTIVSMSPGGYLKYKNDNDKFSAESNLQGKITYQVNDRQPQTTLNEESRKLVAAIIKEMLAAGYDAEGRMERLYKNGGKKALLNEVGNMKSDPLKALYIHRLLSIDSLSKTDRVEIIKKISLLSSDNDKFNFLNKINQDQLKDSIIMREYFDAVDHVGAEFFKENIFKHLIIRSSNSPEILDNILNITGHLSSDFPKENILKQILDNQAITASQFDKILDLSKNISSDFEREGIYTKIIDQNNLTEEQWIRLINDTGKIASDFEKSNLMVHLAKKAPHTDNIKTSYFTVARSIRGDAEYGKAIKAIE